MANTANTSYQSIGSQSKPPTLICEEFQQYLWSELLRQQKGGVTTLKNNRTMCTEEGESLKDTYSRFNILISKCRRSGVIRTNEDNNTLFLNSLGTEWLHLTMSLKTNMDLEMMSLADLYGSLASLEPQSSIGGPLALVAEGGHYAAECCATGPMAPRSQLLPRGWHRSLKQDAAYFKKKVDYYNKKVLLAQTSELVTDESSKEDEPQKGLVAFEESRND
ncbi:hypothetical protein OSB04_024008 [Centaurea solstitialis]|uniref:Uncharacterized protein n=1 Tax=Centaurea solstitialis TaxID=347529 RepID=A0AA38SX19_9ASTR|nr:hypothetical protein OSB04_024008 [Centaurea solstitialis]